MGDVTREMDALAFEGDDLREALRKERARVAELERDFTSAANAYGAQSDEYLSRVAAREAECVELRAALDHLLREWLAWRPGLTGVSRTRAEAILSRPPGSYAALRAVLERLFQATLEATRSHCACDAEKSWSRDEIIARVLDRSDTTEGGRG